ncbi:MAG: tRNA preQ1(34) S-adenosylmethionine ribosyltransferase-isomerase QueA [Spirochaetota bacterium]
MSQKELLLENYDFNLPEELIAQNPLKNRENSRLLVVDITKGEFYEKVFSDIVELIPKNTLIVRNNTRVLKARFYGKKLTGANIEIFLLKNLDKFIWHALARPGKRLSVGTKFILSGGAQGEILEDIGEGIKKIRFTENFNNDYISKFGIIPLPPYIKNTIEDDERYQTVFSDNVNSVAAPTAGLHFTQKIIDKLINNGIEFADVNLGIGLGTFRPLSENLLINNQLHTENYYICKESADIINSYKKQNKNIMAVGTTSVRTLEANYSEFGKINPCEKETDIFIYPGYEFKIVDSMLTNFHLPKSSLIVMISAFAGYELIMEAYKYAVKEKFRFFSFGDCMLIKK